MTDQTIPCTGPTGWQEVTTDRVSMLATEVLTAVHETIRSTR